MANRKQRRHAASRGRAAKPPTGRDGSMAAARAQTEIVEPTGPNSGRRGTLLARMVAWVILAPWVRRRVRHRVARMALAVVARDVGRNDVAAELERAD
jgi:hypothetical protein